MELDYDTRPVHRGRFTGAALAETLLQDLTDACLVARICPLAAGSHRLSLHPLVWDLAERIRKEKSNPQQLAALEAFLRWMLACVGRALGTQCSTGSAAEVEEAKQLLAEELPNVSALAAQLGQPPLPASALLAAEDVVERLSTLAEALVPSGALAVATQLQEVVSAQQRVL